MRATAGDRVERAWALHDRLLAAYEALPKDADRETRRKAKDAVRKARATITQISGAPADDKLAAPLRRLGEAEAEFDALPDDIDPETRETARRRVLNRRSYALKLGAELEPIDVRFHAPRRCKKTPVADRLGRAEERLRERQNEYEAIPSDTDPSLRESARWRVLHGRSYVLRLGGDPGPAELGPPSLRRREGGRITDADTHPSKVPPPEQLRIRLETAREKTTPFAIAFKHALRHIDYPSDSAIEKGWRDALKATREEWEAAYLGKPPLAPGMAVVLSALPVSF